MVFWHAKGWALWQVIEQFMRRVYQDNDYEEVKAPQLLDRSLWERSGHWAKYRDNMFTTESENRYYALKPMNCPGHIQIFNSKLRSYRDLPLRIGEFGQCHRNESSGSLHGLMRVRGFLRTTVTFSARKIRFLPNAKPLLRSCRRSTRPSASLTSPTR